MHPAVCIWTSLKEKPSISDRFLWTVSNNNFLPLQEKEFQLLLFLKTSSLLILLLTSILAHKADPSIYL